MHSSRTCGLAGCAGRSPLLVSTLLLSAVAWGAAASLRPGVSIENDAYQYVPVSIRWESPVEASVMRMCKVPWTAYYANPTVYPMFEDLAASAGCRIRGRPGGGGGEGNASTAARDVLNVREVTFAALEADYAARGCADAAASGVLDPSCAPSGVLFHEARCGSTLFSNMMASLPDVLMFSETGPQNNVIRNASLTLEERVRWLRVVWAAMGRPIALYEHSTAGGAGGRVDELYNASAAPLGAWRPRYMYLKTQHTTSLGMEVYQAAFPRMPWIYIHRDPVEIMMSLMRDSTNAPPPDAPLDRHMTPGDMPNLYGVPCMRTQAEASPPPFIAAVNGYADVAVAKKAVHSEDWCASDLAYVVTAAVRGAITARREVLRRAVVIALARAVMTQQGVQPAALRGAASPVRDAPVADVTPARLRELAHTDVASGAAYAAALQELVPDCVSVRDGMVLDAALESGTVLGVGTGIFVEYRDLPHVVPLLLDAHLHPMSAAMRARGDDTCFTPQLRAAVAHARTAMARGAPPSNELEGMLARIHGDALFTLTWPFDDVAGAPPAGPGIAQPQVPGTYWPISTGNAPQFALVLSPEYLSVMMATSQLYSKARGTVAQLAALVNTPGGIRPFARTGMGRLRSARAWQSINVEGKYVNDEGHKQRLAWPALRAAAAKFLFGLRDLMLAFNVPFSETEKVAMSAVSAGEPESAPAPSSVSGGTGAPPSMHGDAGPGFAGFLRAKDMPDAAVIAAAAAQPEFRATALPLGEGYPQVYPLKQILSEWNPDIVTVPGTYGKYASLRTFDFTTEREEAMQYRMWEVPFVIRNVPALEETVTLWSNDSYLRHMMGPREPYTVEASRTQHFMFYAKAAVKAEQGFQTPTSKETMPFNAWFRQAYTVGAAVVAEEKAQLPAWWTEPEQDSPRENWIVAPQAASDSTSKVSVWPAAVIDAYGLPSQRAVVPDLAREEIWRYYLHLSWFAASSGVAGRRSLPMHGGARPRDTSWIPQHVPFLSTDNAASGAHGANFFIVDAQQNAGIHCRFGMPGIMAEAHYDAGRNFIAMGRGYKRYILAPPDQCKHLGILPDGPSARHSKFNWETPGDMASMGNASALEVVIGPGDVLYVPALWFHFIVSLTINVQCNTRSGTPQIGHSIVQACGMVEPPNSEVVGLHTHARATESAVATTRVLPPLSMAAVLDMAAPRGAAAPAPVASTTSKDGDLEEQYMPRDERISPDQLLHMLGFDFEASDEIAMNLLAATDGSTPATTAGGDVLPAAAAAPAAASSAPGDSVAEVREERVLPPRNWRQKGSSGRRARAERVKRRQSTGRTTSADTPLSESSSSVPTYATPMLLVVFSIALVVAFGRTLWRLAASRCAGSAARVLGAARGGPHRTAAAQRHGVNN